MTQYRFIALFAATMLACGSSSTDDASVRVDLDLGLGTSPAWRHRRHGTTDPSTVSALPAPTTTATQPTSTPAPQSASLYPSGVKYRGINRAGAEYGDDWDGWTGQSWFEWPSSTQLASELAYLDSIGFNTVRLPISWERLQHSLGGALNQAYVTNLTSTVAQITAAGFQVIVDLHNYNRYATGTYTSDQGTTQSGSYSQHVLGDGTLTNAHVIDVWTRLAPLFKDNTRVVLELMNESHDFSITSDAYFALVNEQIAAVRATGAANLIIVPNSRASDITHWTTYAPNGGSLDSVAALSVKDSSNNYAFVVHQYDSYPSSSTQYRDLLTAITSWARTNGKRLFLTELGVVDSGTYSQSALTNVLQYMNDNADVWLGWSPWNLAPFSITSDSYTQDSTQMNWYRPFLTPGTASAAR